MDVTVCKLLAQADEQLNSGHAAEALISLLEARNAHYNRSSQIEHLLGICYRLRGEFEKAEEAFDRALEYVGDVRQDEALNRGRIMRDKAMLFLVQKRYVEARELLGTSRTLLSQQEEAPHDVNGRIEYFVTVGFTGRLHGEMGELDEARKCFSAADTELRGRTPYELNNLVWWMKVESFRTRCRLAQRALLLAQQANNHRRVLQIIALTATSPKLIRRIAR